MCRGCSEIRDDSDMGSGRIVRCDSATYKNGRRQQIKLEHTRSRQKCDYQVSLQILAFTACPIEKDNERKD